jgi:hypothetical protein
MLVNLKARALRGKFWFRVLSPLERNIIDLTIKVVDRVRSPLLARVLQSIVNKLVEALEGKIHRLTDTMGRQIAEKISCIARSWGIKPLKNGLKNHSNSANMLCFAKR